MKRVCLVVFKMTLYFLLSASCVHAATYYVTTTGNDSNPGTQVQPFRTILRAITSSGDGDTILVAAGTYSENITWATKSLTLKGAGAGLSIIDGGHTGSCLTLTNVPSPARIEGFTLQNGYAFNGGGIFNSGGSPALISCTFSGNRADDKGGGMFNFHGSPTISNCTFTDDSADTGGGLFNSAGSSTVTNCAFTGNHAFRDGGGMYNDISSSAVTNCTFIENSANGGGGGMFNSGGMSTVTKCTFSANNANDGGGIYDSDGDQLHLHWKPCSPRRRRDVQFRWHSHSDWL